MRRNFLCLLASAAVLSLASCTTTKFVPDGSYLLDEVKIRTDQKNIRPSSLRMYVRQNPNAKWFSLIKTQLYVYNLSGRDSTKWGNKFLRRIGDAPVIYSEDEAKRSEEEITKAVHNMGYMAATVKRSTKIKKKKIKLYYDVTAGKPYVVQSIKYDIYDPKIASLLKQDSARSLLKEGMYLDVNVLDADRQRITNKLLRNGYYKFNKDYIGYTADTVRNTYNVDLTQHLQMYKAHASDSARAHQQYWINKINFITDYDVLQSSALSSVDINDSVHYKGYPIYYKDKLYLRPKVLTDNLRFASGDLFNERDVQQTYSSFGRLSALKYTNIRFIETQVGDSTMLDCYVMLTKSKHKSVSFEVEGTNSAGDLGAAASVSFQNRNLFRGSETFMIKFRGAYEVISGLQAGYSNNNYTEYGVETSINFPNFLFPFISSDFKRKIRATTEFGLQYNYQLRPEFLRTMASANWSYKWTQRQKIQHRIDLINIAFLYLPRISERFKEDYINKGQNHIFQYNYQDRLIINMGYSYNYNSVGGSIINNTIASNSYSIRFNFESAGNIMYALFIRRMSTKALTALIVLAGIGLASFAIFNFSGAGHLGVGWTMEEYNLIGGFLRVLFSFSMGLLMSRVFKPIHVKGAFWICSLAIVVLLSMPYVGDGEALWMNGIYDSVCAILIFPMLVYLGASGKTTDKHSARICKFLGDISYPLYMVHYPLIYLYFGWVKKENLTFAEAWPEALALVIGSIVLAYISLKLYDEPVRRYLTKRFLQVRK